VGLENVLTNYSVYRQKSGIKKSMKTRRIFRKQNGKFRRAEYRAYIAGLMEGNDTFSVTASFNLIQLTIPDANSLLNQFAEEKTEYETRTVTKTKKNADKKWYKPWTWFDPEYIDYQVEETSSYSVKVINMSKLSATSIQPNFNQFLLSISKAADIAEEKANDLKNYFQQSIDKLDNALKETANRQRKEVETEESLEKSIKENKAKVEWLEDFIEDLNEVLKI
jgi:hypothetical protein